LPCSAFHLSILSEVWLRNFLRQTTTNEDGSITYVSDQFNNICFWRNYFW
jgi:ABC-type uncharacterized transport system ATPase subunit